jgi:hypothetical protein
MKMTLGISALSITLAATSSAHAQSPSGNAIPVTVDNFVLAESDLYMGNMVTEGGLGKLHHRREPARIDDQIVIRLNRDKLYSSGVFDLDAEPVCPTRASASCRCRSSARTTMCRRCTTAPAATP